MRTTTIWLLLTVFAAFVFAQDSTPEAAASKVIALIYAWDQAEKRNDAKALDSLLDDSLVYTDYDGKVLNKAQILEMVKAQGSQRDQQAVESTSTQVYGNVVIVSGIYKVSGATNAKPYARRGRFMLTWASRDGKWLCVAAHFTLLDHKS